MRQNNDINYEEFIKLILDVNAMQDAVGQLSSG